MPVNLKGRSYLKLLDYTPEEILYLLNLAADLKAKKRMGIIGETLRGKNIALIFEKTSTRTRCAFEVAAYDEGAHVTNLTNSQMGTKESIEDTARVLGRFYDGIEFRGYKQETVEALAKYSGVPVWNGLTDEFHPTQFLACMLTIMENVAKPLSEVKLTFVGDAKNNVANSLLIGCAKLGVSFTAIAPKECFPSAEIVNAAEELAKQSGSVITITTDKAAVLGSDAVYTDVWVSMGEGDKFAERIALLSDYTVDSAMMKATGNPRAIFMHCLPAFHDLGTSVGRDVNERFGMSEMEVTDEVFRSSASRVFEEAENRLHTIKAVMVATMS